jgi:hypothetical protein
MKKIYLLLYLTLRAGIAFAQDAGLPVYGCTDPLSATYNPNATVNDGSCTYASATVTPSYSVALPQTIDETSGLVLWGGALYTHNDDTDTNLYRISPVTGSIDQTLSLPGTINQDWEDTDQDNNYIYIGDFGNNATGNRANLRILRIAKSGLIAGTPVPETISFSYPDQPNLNDTGANNTDFDCEAMVVSSDYIYLFTKQWVSRRTSVYRVPKTPGAHTATLMGTYNVNGLITGATYIQDARILALCGYTTTLSPFIYLMYDFQGDDFFGGNKRRLAFQGNFLQIEGIASEDGLNYYISNEHFSRVGLINVPARVYTVNLGPYLQQYLGNEAQKDSYGNGLVIAPVPGSYKVILKSPDRFIGSTYTIVDEMGKIVGQGYVDGPQTEIDISSFAVGTYAVRVTGKANGNVRLIKE